MIYAYPTLEEKDRAVLAMIQEQRNLLRHQVNQNPGRWTGFLRRNTFARALQGSNSIEGFNANLAEAVAIVDEERPETLEEETLSAITGYRNAMTYIVRVHDDPYAEVNAQFIRALHYMMLSYDLTKYPGQWRPGSIHVVRDPEGDVVYEGPDAAEVPILVELLVDQITDTPDADSTVLAAMAHLNLTMIHPFKDGNGRMARALQTLVMARDGIFSPVFCSIEEWLGRNTDAYYSVLAQVGEGHWNPSKSALPWVRFCLVAHYQQAATLMRRNNEFSRVWQEIERVRADFQLPDRMDIALMDATYGILVRNHRYREENEISDVVASRDLKRLCDVGLLRPMGEKRGRYYVAGEPLLEIRRRLRDRTRAPNPYDVIQDRAEARQLDLPGFGVRATP
jgi:Fic family protein